MWCRVALEEAVLHENYGTHVPLVPRPPPKREWFARRSQGRGMGRVLHMSTFSHLSPLPHTVSPYQDLEKATVLQECRVFHDANIVTQDPRRCCQLITKLLHILTQVGGEEEKEGGRATSRTKATR